MPDKEKQVGLPKIDYNALSKSLHDQGTLAEQYGGVRGEQRGTKLKTERFNQAFDEYAKENPDADKERFLSNVYTTTAKDEENLTPWQVRARKDLEESAGLAAEDQEAFRTQQTENFGSLDDRAKNSRGGKAINAIAKLKGTALPSDIKNLVKRHAGGGTLSPGTLKDKDFATIQKFLETRQGTAAGAGANEILQGLYKQNPSPVQRSPLYRMGSPFKQTNPYAYQNYTRLDEAAESIEAQQQKQRDLEDRRYKKEMQQFQYAEMKAKQAEALIVPGDTGFNNIDLAMSTASRGLVDQAGALTAQLKKGDINTDEYANQLALIRSQVPALKQWKESLSQNLTTYTEALQNGQLSDAMNPQSLDLYGTLLKDDGSVQLGIGEDGSVTMAGVTEGGEPISIPVTGIGNMPKPILKQPSPYEQLKGPMKEIQQRLISKEGNEDEISDYARAQFDSVVEQGGDQAVLSMAVDHMGLSYEEAKKLEGTPLEGYRNALEKQVEDNWVNAAGDMFVADEFKQKQQLINQQKLQQQKQQAAQNADIAQQRLDIAREQQDAPKTGQERQYADNVSKAERLFTPDFLYQDPQSYSDLGYGTIDAAGLGKEQRAQVKQKYGTDQGFFIDTGKTKVFVPTGEHISSQQMRARVARGLYGVDPTDLSPLDRKTPFSRKLFSWLDKNILRNK